jgi:hypothetical protein
MNHESDGAEDGEVRTNWRSLGDLAARLREVAEFRREGTEAVGEDGFAPVAWAAE